MSETSLPTPGPPEAEAPKDEQRSLKRLLALRLPLSVVLARKDLCVSDALQLRPGDVLEFEKRVDDPLEVVIHHKTIARGTAVKSGEKFALKIVRILSPEETVRLLGPPDGKV